MAARGKGWTNPDQKVFLHEKLPLYREHKRARNFPPFWQALFAQWQETFPLIKELFPGRKYEELADTEKEQYKQAWAQRRVVSVNLISFAVAGRVETKHASNRVSTRLLSPAELLHLILTRVCSS
jgi:hypothetical protein